MKKKTKNTKQTNKLIDKQANEQTDKSTYRKKINEQRENKETEVT
jgi:hypothetical protein